MEVGAFAEIAHEGGRDEALVHEEIGLSIGVEVDGGGAAVDGEGVHGVEVDVGDVPVEGIFYEANAVIDAPCVELVSAVADEMAGLDPIVAPLLDTGEILGEERGGGAEAEEEWGGIVEGDAEGVGVQSGDADL
jgi:hypothetical protein